MATVNASSVNSNHLSYISCQTFNNDIFTYTTSLDAKYNATGSLSAVTGATASNCPKGRVLCENGRKLYPKVNVGVSTYMIGVYDKYSFLSGFIDPNSPVFALYNTNKSDFQMDSNYFQKDGVDPGPGGLTDLGPPVYTNGNITTKVGDITATAGAVTAKGQVRSNTNTVINIANGVTAALDISLGQLFTVNVTSTSPSVAGTAGINALWNGSSNLADSVGSVVYIKLVNTGGAACVVTFGTQIREVSGPATLAAGTTWMFTYVSDGSNLLETARSAGPLLSS